MLDEAISISKSFAVALCFAGIVVVTVTDAKDENPATSAGATGSYDEAELGDLLSLGSAVSYAVYTVTLKKVVKSESRINMMLFFGLLGVVNAVAVVPILGMAHLTGVEAFEWPSRQTLVLLTVNGLIGTVVSDYLWARSVLLLTPLISTLGLSLTIPCSMLAQALLFEDAFSPWYLLGAGLTFAGFILVNLDSDSHDGAGRSDLDIMPVGGGVLRLVSPSPRGLRGLSGEGMMIEEDDIDLAMEVCVIFVFAALIICAAAFSGGHGGSRDGHGPARERAIETSRGGSRRPRRGRG